MSEWTETTKYMRGEVRKAARVRHWPINHYFWANCQLLVTLVKRDLEARYKGSVLGNLWPLVNQLSQLLIFIYVFSIILKVKLNLQGLPTENKLTFGLWLFAGLIPWSAFTTGLSRAAGSVIEQVNLVKKVVFPLALLPLVPILSAFIESTMGLMTLILAVAIFFKTLHLSIFLFPIVWIPQLLLTIGLGYLVASLSVFLRDIPQSLGVILNLWFYVTPIVYPANVIPKAWRVWIFWLNPFTAITEVYRDLVLTGKITHRGELLVATIMSTVIFLIGWWVYHKLRPAFADVL